MAYTVENFKTKKSLMEAIALGKEVRVFQPGPFGPEVGNGACSLEGPHSPAPHSWYAIGIVQDGKLVGVK